MLLETLLNLKDVLEIDKFQKIQDDIAEATEMSIITVDFKGKPATKHSRCSEFCKLMRANKTYSEVCERCDSRGGLEAARLEKPYIYRCHRGLIDFATPIIVNGQYLGSVMAGQVLIEDDNDIEFEDIMVTKDDFEDLEEEEREKILNAYKRLPVIKQKRLEAVAEMMFHISNYIVEEAFLKIAQKELNEKNIKFMESKKAQAELEKEYKSCQLKALQSQINPHFLFNTLNSISSLAIVENATKTQEVIYNLSNILRYTLKKANKIVRLEEEIGYIESYLNLQKIRFAQRLNYEINIDSKLKGVKIPFMILQNFVENSVVHGLESKEEGGWVKIYCEDKGDLVSIYIEDNGIGISREKLNEIKEELKFKYGTDLEKIGINNVNKRMAHYYGDDYKINIESRIRKGTLVEVTIPKEL